MGARRGIARVVMAIVVLGSVAALASCVPVGSVDFGNFTYQADACGELIPEPPEEGYELVDGALPATHPGAVSVTLRPDIAYGDLTGDGVDEAALILDCTPGNRPVPVGRVMAAGVDAVRPLAPVPAPDVGARRVELEHLEIVEGVLVTQWIVLRDDDPWCCPTGRTTVHLRWEEDRFVVAEA